MNSISQFALFFCILISLNLHGQNPNIGDDNAFILEYHLIKEYITNSELIYKIPESYSELGSNTKELFNDNEKGINDKFDQQLQFEIIGSIGKLSGNYLEYNSINLFDADCISNNTSQKAKKFLGLSFNKDQGDDLFEQIIYTDILLNSYSGAINSLYALMYEFSKVKKIPIEECYLFVNCNDRTWSPFFIYPNNGLTLRRGESKNIRSSIPIGYVSKKYYFKNPIDANNYNQESILSSIQDSLKNKMIQLFSKKQVSEKFGQPKQLTISNVRNEITFNDGFWEEITLSLYRGKITNTYIELMSVFQGSYYESNSPFPPSTGVWKKDSNQLRANLSYSNMLDSYALDILDLIWLDLRVQFEVKN